MDLFDRLLRTISDPLKRMLIVTFPVFLLFQTYSYSSSDNKTPRADAGPDRKMLITDKITLDGQGSRIPGSDRLTYKWSIINRPAGSNITIRGDRFPIIYFEADVGGVYEVQLTVSDGTSNLTDTVMIDVMGKPTVNLTADPPVISLGDTVTLSWQTLYANTVRIDPDIGSVALNGSVKVTPSEIQTYTLTATGPAGKSKTEVLVTIDTPFLLRITSPSDKQTIYRHNVLVRGIIKNSTGLETGITVNGIQALQYNNQFIANHVPLVQGENTIMVKAMDAAGKTHNERVSVNADIKGQFIWATTEPEMGLAPFKGDFRIKAPTELYHCTVRESDLNRSKVQQFGPSNVNFGLGPPELRTLAISRPGLYLFEVEAKSTVTQIFTDEVAVLVCDTKQISNLLLSKWNAMKVCLAAGDVSGALEYFSRFSRADYEKIFTSLGDKLPQIAQQMEDIELIHFEDGFVKCRIWRDEIIAGETRRITYKIYFSTDENGIWKIDRF